ncbi:MAG: D-hexose-6-phosphate mutarotase, partial [Burkholderiales bacterium]|nr:D-hexose-6-phosphate mutarotase [Burkholderiales bacterium]
RHGFARLTKWAVEECGILDDGSAFGEFVLAPQDLKPELALQFPCRVALRVTIQGQKMDLQLQVDNLGKETVSAACALHTYFALDDTEKTQVFGFQGQNYVELGTPGVQEAAGIPIIGKVERQFRGSAGPLRIEDGTRAIELQQSGFPDAVVWNPGAADAAALADLGDEEYRHFVCVEPVTLQRVEIAAGQSWIGRHQLLISAKN